MKIQIRNVWAQAMLLAAKVGHSLGKLVAGVPGANFVAGAVSRAGAALIGVGHLEHGITIRQHYHLKCWRDGKLLWEEDYDNLVATAGRNKYLDATLKTGLASPLWYCGLVTGPGGSNTYAAADTMSSHAGWAENVTYSQSTRPAFTPGTISGGSVDNASAVAVFTINGSTTLGGAFIADNSTKSGSTGTLLGVGSFTGGDRSVVLNDTINLTVTCSIT